MKITKNTILMIVCLILLTPLASPTYASPILFEFSGTAEITDNYGLLEPNVPSTLDFSGSVIVDPDLIIYDPSSPDWYISPSDRCGFYGYQCSFASTK